MVALTKEQINSPELAAWADEVLRLYNVDAHAVDRGELRDALSIQQGAMALKLVKDEGVENRGPFISVGKGVPHPKSN